MEPPAAAWGLLVSAGTVPRGRGGLGGTGQVGVEEEEEEGSSAAVSLAVAQSVTGTEVRAGRREPCVLSLGRRSGRYG